MELAQIPFAIRDFFFSYGLLGKIALYVPLLTSIVGASLSLIAPPYVQFLSGILDELLEEPLLRNALNLLLAAIELPLFAALFFICGVTKLIRAAVRPLVPSMTRFAFPYHGGNALGAHLQTGPLKFKLDTIAWCLITDVIMVCFFILFWRSFGPLWLLYQLSSSLSVFVLLRMGSMVEDFVFTDSEARCGSG
ncbi:hypothetical protein KFL_003030090 [Klebsormidium nitens]|uniref:Uncharacterized protein n=1 Tax=Klebsormidium nitens TaxID=105231 RepID=A0A1Y1ID85_KLENI|nr:hypothetical protein KFL_003030090 [Klebsormidium nitens]|eukprot:GAQ86666.1 hypothetical protein KFL_003030090 [Klebsormidium nitens]